MPTSKIYKSSPELIKARVEIKEYMLRVIGKCEVTGKRDGNLDLHEGLVPAGFTERMKPENARPVLAHICLNPFNLFLIDHDTHIGNKPSIEIFYTIARLRDSEFYQNFPTLNDTITVCYTNAIDACEQFYGIFDIFKAYGIIKTLPIKPANMI